MAAKIKKVLIIYGGRSVEHEISIRSAKNIVENIDRKKFEPVLVGIAKNGDWFYTETVLDKPQKGEPVSIDLISGSPFLKMENVRTEDFEVVFPILHGTDGEDGGVQGFFQVLDVPVVGSDVLGSAISMDKTVTKLLLKAHDVPVVPFMILTKEQAADISFKKIVKKLGLPFMVKAANLGSSVGISKVSEKEQFEPALAEAFKFTHTLLIESFVKCRELECGILGNEQPEATMPGEIVIKGDYEFYTYAAKYLDKNAIDIVIPASVSEKVSNKIRKHCVEAYQALHCKDYARVDVFLTEKNDIYINEINTIPGFTNVSMFPMLWQQMGIGYTELITRLIELASERWKSNQKLEKSYK